MLDGERKGREKGTAEGVDVSGAASSRPGFVALFLFPVFFSCSFFSLLTLFRASETPIGSVNVSQMYGI